MLLYVFLVRNRDMAGGLNSRDLISHSSAGCRPEVKVWAVTLSEASLPGLQVASVPGAMLGLLFLQEPLSYTKGHPGELILT